MKRYPSLDFLRGLSILMMLILHMVSDFLNVNAIIDNLNNVPLINIVALIVFPYLGGLAGFFLMISAVSNMVSMEKFLQRGKSPSELMKRQVLGGILIIIFAMLIESTIGYWGSFGRIFRSQLDWIDGLLVVDFKTNHWITALYRWNTFETIHTIGWCVLVNGFIQGLISRNDGWKDPKKQIKIYVILAIVVVVLTQPVWDFVAFLVPGYPWASAYSSGEIYQPVIGEADIGYLIASPFLAALAAPMEPLFPYLAVSFIGSIIGIALSQPKETISFEFLKKIMIIGLIMFIIGSIGVILIIISIAGLDFANFEYAAEIYQHLPYHRHWVPERFPGIMPFAWLFQFLSLNGFGTIAILIIIRLVEFRGKAKEFADKSRFVRRFGFTALNNYTIQWIFVFWGWAMSVVINNDSYTKLTWAGTWLTIGIVLLTYHIVMLLWEKSKYFGTIEWWIGTIALNFIPSRKIEGESKKKWWEKGQLDVEGAFYDAEWLNIIDKDKIDHENLRESKLAYKLSAIALISLVFMPISIITLLMARNSIKTEKENNYNKKATILSIIGIIIVILFFVMVSILTPSDLGIAL